MKLKEFANSMFLLPAVAAVGLSKLVFGHNQTVNTVNGTAARPRPGLLGVVLGGISYVGRAFSDFVSNHKTAIATAFWLSAAVAGGLALTLALWPAALTAVAGFTVMGLSIAGIVGANTALQIGLAAGLAAAATSVATYVTAAIVGIGQAIANLFRKKPAPVESSSSEEDLLHKSSNDKDFSNSHNPLRKLSSSSELVSDSSLGKGGLGLQKQYDPSSGAYYPPVLSQQKVSETTSKGLEQSHEEDLGLKTVGL